jgi:hypothetical protein
LLRYGEFLGPFEVGVKANLDAYKTDSQRIFRINLRYLTMLIVSGLLADADLTIVSRILETVANDDKACEMVHSLATVHLHPCALDRTIVA